MPLDGTEMFGDPTLAKLWEVECMLATEDQWCKGRLHDRKGRHCLVGAITEVNGRQELTRPIIRAIKETSGKHYWRIESFNDDPNTSHQDVLRVLHRARLIVILDIARSDEPKPWYLKLRQAIDEIFAISIGNSELYGDSDPEPVLVRVNETARGDERARSAEPIRETIDMLQ